MPGATHYLWVLSGLAALQQLMINLGGGSSLVVCDAAASVFTMRDQRQVLRAVPTGQAANAALPTIERQEQDARTECPSLSKHATTDTSSDYSMCPHPYTALMHRFEGDGMVHATRIKDGAASYCNHWVRTHKLQQEQRAGFPIYAKVGRVGGRGCLF